MVSIIFAGEHATEFEFGQLSFKISQFSLGFNKSLFVFCFNGEFNETRDVFQALIQFIDGVDDLFECGAFFTQRLGFFRLIPDRGIFQFARDFF